MLVIPCFDLDLTIIKIPPHLIVDVCITLMRKALNKK